MGFYLLSFPPSPSVGTGSKTCSRDCELEYTSLSNLRIPFSLHSRRAFRSEPYLFSGCLPAAAIPEFLIQEVKPLIESSEVSLGKS